MRQRVVITGMGAVTPLGNNVPDFWAAVKSGTSGVAPITRFDTTDFQTKIAAEVKGFDAKDYIDKKDARKMDLFSQYAVVASLEALKDSGNVVGETVDPFRIGVVLGIGIGGFETLEDSYFQLIGKGPGRVPPMTIPKLISNIGPGNVSIAVGAYGPSYSMATACASGTDAIGNAARLVADGAVDVVIAGGVEACITRMGIAGFNVIQALSTNFNDQPTLASRPFDKDRDGFVMGEGAGIVVIETLERAVARGATIYAEIGAAAMTCDADHLTAPNAEGRGIIAAMKSAVAEAGLEMDGIDYINAHGTSTPINDPTESKAVEQAFGEHAYKLKMSSTKSMHGHCVGAAGGVEAIVCALALRDQFYPPTINLDEADSECKLDYVPKVGVSGEMRTAMSNSLGFGGHNGVLILKRYEA
ncbi:MAG: beta-ketoacyl-[acyl-carrier-protein] synthase II [Spirochaetaceae bacterium]|nr:MAG: beta-ketoacyl-[acyl-carrier-protein] synthase II [Spirochaetaceae bacterium]